MGTFSIIEVNEIILNYHRFMLEPVGASASSEEGGALRRSAVIDEPRIAASQGARYV